MSAATPDAPMTPDEWAAQLRVCYVLASALRAIPITQMLAAISIADSIGPIIDPTLWMSKSDKMRQDESVLQALRAAQVEIEKLPWPKRDGEVAG